MPDEMLPQVEVALMRLASLERDLLCLVAVHGHSYRDAAHRLGIDPQSAAQHLQFGLHALRADPDFASLFTPPTANGVGSVLAPT